MIPPLFGLPVEVWVNILNHYLLPEVAFGYQIDPFQIEAYQRALFDGEIDDAIQSANRRRPNLRLVCRDWTHILDTYVDEGIPRVIFDNNAADAGQSSRSNQFRFRHLSEMQKDEHDSREQLLVWAKTDNRLFTLSDRTLAASLSSTKESLRSLPIQILRLHICGSTSRFRFASFKDVQNIVHYPENLKVLHLASNYHRVTSGFFKSVATTFANLEVLSLSVVNIVSIDAITFPQLSTLMLEISFHAWLDKLSESWHFPSLRHLSFQVHKGPYKVLFFQNILERYGGQLRSLRCPTFKLISHSCPNLSLPRLEALATDLIDLEPGDIQLLTSNPCPIRFLIHSWNILNIPPFSKVEITTSGAMDLSRTSVLYRLSQPHVTKKAEVKMYEAFTRRVSLFPQLEAIYIPTEFFKIRNRDDHYQLDDMIIEKFSLLRDLCNSSGIRILDLHGDQYPPINQ